MDSDDVAVFDAQVVTDNTVDSGTAIIEVVIGQDDQDGVFSLLALDQDCVTTEELQRLHGIVRERNDRVVVVRRICDPVATKSEDACRGNFCR